ncbi:MAG: D-alanine--D-alanine ligase [Parcubacteria group bacterium]|nr:D-alanine--D-alanine ligase [Parcubacteria group bacterium]
MSISSGSKKRVIVLRGGPSSDYAASLKTGEHVLSLLREKPDTYEPIDVFISKDDEWHVEGMKKEPHEALKHADIAFNALHGHYGESGKVQRMLSHLHIPFTGTKSIESALARHHTFKQVLGAHDIRTPQHDEVTAEDDATRLTEVFREYLHPMVVKSPRDADERIVRLAYTFDELVLAVGEVLRESPKAIIEEFVRGKEAKVAVVDRARGQKLYSFMPIEVRTPKKGKQQDFEAKFKEKPEYLFPTSFSTDEHKILEGAAKEAHSALGLRHYSHSNLILTPAGNVYVLNISSLPEFHADSLLSQSLTAAGWTHIEFLEHLLGLASGTL